MIRINVFVQIRESESRKAVIDTAKELVDKSVNEPGCMEYDIYGSLNEDNHLMIVETWSDREALERHIKTDHFRRLVPELESLATLTLQQFDF